MTENLGALERATFLDAMARRASSVSVVTVRHREEVHGVTVSSLVSLSADPPMVLVSLHRASRVLSLIEGARAFGIAILAEDQESVARACASPARGPMPAAAFDFDASGVPLLAGASATLAVKLVSTLPLADHLIVVGRVYAAVAFDSRPLLYHERRYRRLEQQR